jgi:hypothetical protein
MRFQGRRIVDSVFQSLLAHQQLDQADVVVIVGGLGIMSYLDELVGTYFRPDQRVIGLCDGCLLIDLPSFFSPTNPSSDRRDSFSSPSASAPSSTLIETLQAGWKSSIWNASLSTLAQSVCQFSSSEVC